MNLSHTQEMQGVWTFLSFGPRQPHDKHIFHDGGKNPAFQPQAEKAFWSYKLKNDS